MLIRIIIGDYWYFKTSPTETFESNLSISQRDYSEVLSFESNSEISLLYLRLFPKDGQQLSPADFRFEQPDVLTGQIGDTITMLLVDIEGNQVLTSGEHRLFSYSGEAELGILGSAVDVFGRETALVISAEPVLPETPILYQNYPNPFNPSTTIEFILPAETDWKLEIYNVTGQKIRSFSGNGAGSQTVFWNGTNNSGQKVSSGVYFYKLIASGVSNSRKMLLLK
ncbi:MAG: T9SS type A sorting domain-containing protein [candidate division Zixibacteria bacterium]|nr:T9SS type A sorting domain-containing protein [candidate division Zixibacteria bacterium]